MVEEWAEILISKPEAVFGVGKNSSAPIHYCKLNANLDEPPNSRPHHTIRYSGLYLREYKFNNISTSINRKTAGKVFNAWDFAEALERPINYFCVIHLKDPFSQSANTAFAKIRRLFGDWLRGKSNKHDVKYHPTYVYTFENPNNNIHVNWCLHIAPELEIEFLEKLPVWITKTQGLPLDTTIYTSKIEYGIDSYKAVANYILKGVDPEFAEHFFLDQLQKQKGAQGAVFGKRAGFSQSIGTTAQRRAMFNAKHHRAKRVRSYQ